MNCYLDIQCVNVYLCDNICGLKNTFMTQKRMLLEMI